LTNQYITSLIASFPWLTEAEASGVAEQLGEVEGFASAAEQIGALASVLDRAGLPPTSTLLLNLAGRGSKKTAVDVARNVARARFEHATCLRFQGHGCGSGAISVAPATDAGLGEADVRATVRAAVEAALATRPNLVVGGDQVATAAGLSEKQVREIVHATVEATLAMMPGAFGGGAGDERILKLIEGVLGEVRWLRSTIDTERQLRRYREAHGPLPEHQAPKGPATTEERRDIVHQLAHSLERDRYSAHVASPIDSADGRDE
jgi:hypothetical protein